MSEMVNRGGEERRASKRKFIDEMDPSPAMQIMLAQLARYAEELWLDGSGKKLPEGWTDWNETQASLCYDVIWFIHKIIPPPYSAATVWHVWVVPYLNHWFKGKRHGRASEMRKKHDSKCVPRVCSVCSIY